MIQAKLKLEIMAGYLVLVSCLAFIICLVHKEREKRSVMERQELYWQGERRLTDRTYRPGGYVIRRSPSMRILIRLDYTITYLS